MPNRRTNRRNMLRQMAGATLALPAILSCSCRSRQAPTSSEDLESLRTQEKLARSPNEQIGVGIIGCGDATGN